jgi:hypothetical protein
MFSKRENKKIVALKISLTAKSSLQVHYRNYSQLPRALPRIINTRGELLFIHINWPSSKTSVVTGVLFASP